MTMREIKFRGKCIPEFPHPVAKWVYGSFVSDKLILSPYKERNENRHFWYMVEPDTVGQYTGLRDADGREIYEGDIVEATLKNKSFVTRFHMDETVVGNISLDGAWLLGEQKELWRLLRYYSLKVIGNVHDNPGLLEAQNARD